MLEKALFIKVPEVAEQNYCITFFINDDGHTIMQGAASPRFLLECAKCLIDTLNVQFMKGDMFVLDARKGVNTLI
ncbi:MAG: hypothetical protein WC364_04775 [Eubacteriales bacterium]|jgi:hypothetical protein